jgi:Icc-related predicted phosphoesterase
MKLLILSDLHNEFEPFEPVTTDADVVILAGDIGTKARAVQWAASAFGSLPIVLVAGNHDLWGSSIPRGYVKMREAAQGTNVHVLQNEQVVIDGVRFLGCTLWTNYRLTGNQPLAMWDARQRMTNDFRKIRNATYGRSSPAYMRDEHAKSVQFLAEQLDAPFAGRTVVVTHHAPTGVSIPKQFREQTQSHLNAAYASNLEHMMGEAVQLWVHGHTHDSVDLDIAGTRVVCNPRGYAPDDLNPEFQPGLVVEC